MGLRPGDGNEKGVGASDVGSTTGCRVGIGVGIFLGPLVANIVGTVAGGFGCGECDWRFVGFIEGALTFYYMAI